MNFQTGWAPAVGPRPVWAVEESADSRRIRALPMVENHREIGESLVDEYSELLRQPHSTARLKWPQALGLHWIAEFNGAYLGLPPGVGKALAHGEPVLTTAGWRQVQELRVGEEAIGSDGRPTEILGVYPQGQRETWRVTFSDGVSVLCDRDHLWTFRVKGGGVDAGVKRWTTRTTAAWAQESLRTHATLRGSRVFAPMLTAPVWAPAISLPLDPYTLGALLGDGGMTQTVVSFTTADSDILGRLVLPKGITARAVKHQNCGKATQYNLTGGRRGPLAVNPLTKALRDLGLLGCNSRTKFIPPDYLRASAEQRLALLQGLLDTDGHHQGRARVEFCSMSRALAEGVVDIVQSLGGTAPLRQYKTGAWRIVIKLPQGVAPFACARKAATYASTASLAQRPPFRAVVEIKQDGFEPCTCISVAAPDRLFLTRGCVLTHNTLITMLAPVVLDSPVSALIAPATLHRDKTTDDFARYKKDWIPHYKSPTLLNLEALSLDQNLLMLDKLKPRLVMIDEGDLLRNPEAASFVRLDRYRTATLEANPGAAFVVLTGSGMRFGIEDYATHINWCLPWGQSPIPYDEAERNMWFEALRSRPKGRPSNASRRPRAGVLLSLCALPNMPADERPRTEIETAQAIVARRINATPGVLIIDDEDCDQPITIRLVRAPDDPIIDEDFARFYGASTNALEMLYEEGDTDITPAWCLPDPGLPCTNGLEVWQALRSLGCGYFTYPDPPPPEEYAIARRAYAKRVRSLIAASVWSNDPADTPGAAKRRYPNDPVIVNWETVQRKPFPPSMKPFKANMVLKQRSSSVVDYCAKWMQKNNGIVWCGSVPMAQWIARAAGVKYYGAGGRAADGSLLDRIPTGERAVASIQANSRGRNIQDRHHTGLIVQLPQSADECHQLFKRYWRFGQTKPVRWDVLITSGAARFSFDMALYEARLVKKQRRQTQTILRATIEDCILDPTNPRWFRKPAPH